MLADMGADVIKVEPPEGDQMRQAGRPKQGRGMGPVHMTLNRGKRSIARPEAAGRCGGHARPARRCRRVRSQRARCRHRPPGVRPESVGAIRPDIIYVHCVGFGSDGPYAGLQAYDDVIQAATGTTTLLPRADGDARPRFVPSLIADKVSGLYGAQAVLAALFHRQRTGEGQLVEVPMFECFAQFMLQEHLYGEVHDDPVQPAGYPRQVDPHRQPFPTRDGWVSIVPYTAHTIARVFEVLEATEVFDDPRFATDLDRLRNVSLLYAEIARRTPARTSAEWVRILNAAGVPAWKCAICRISAAIRTWPRWISSTIATIRPKAAAWKCACPSVSPPCRHETSRIRPPSTNTAPPCAPKRNAATSADHAPGRAI
jgi:crotonobetainyl-CoA:carnitine CoA-transferase CaiB-like acyl-CoA transferase